MALNTNYFKDLVTSETLKFNELCDKWTQIMSNDSDISEDGLGQIRTTIGQTNLFINQRFKQFSGLIDDCELKRGTKETKVEDLQGFWDMIYYQIIELHNKFDYLLTLKSNNWIEIKQVVEQTKKKIPSKTQLNGKQVSKQISVKPSVKSTIRQQIESLKSKKLEQNVDKNSSFGEKENLKIKNCIESGKANNSAKLMGSNKKLNERQYECHEVRNVLKRTPLLNAVKK